MKKLFALAVIFALVLGACPQNDEESNGNENNADIIGMWTGTNTSYGTVIDVSLNIVEHTFVLVLTYHDDEGQSDSVSGTWTREGNNLRLYSSMYGVIGTASLSGNTLILYIVDMGTVQLNKQDSPVTGGSTSLKIQNESFSEITEVRWSSTSFTQSGETIKNGSSITRNVQEGNGYIYFKRSTYPINARTDQPVVVEKNEPKVIVINDNTIIVDVDNPNNKGTFGTLGVTREPQITVQAGSSAIAQFGDYDFGSSLLNTNKDVTFTIGNSGRADLRFNVVSGNVINLNNNASGYFSVTQQPFASMTISPGSTTTFVIRFSPTAAGNNFNAEVTIVTNSENDSEFTFRVKGNGSNEYKIGDAGPGGGMVFFAEGGQYKECSGELGTYYWNDAMTTAQNYKGGGFTDWHLPDSGELDLMYMNLHKKGLGGFSGVIYWSSTESFTSYAYIQSFSSGSKSTDIKTYSYRVRAVRSFSL